MKDDFGKRGGRPSAVLDGFRSRAATLLRDGKVWMVVGLGFAGVVFGGAGAAVGAWTQACSGGCPTAAEIEHFAPQQASELYDADGGLLGLFYRERRQLVSLDELPSHVPLAFVAIEDRRFFEHEGVDIRRIAGAVRDNLLDGFAASGASTISMQLARNLFPEQLPRGEKTLRRKIAEARLALAMERQLSKERILELYLNHIFLGAGAFGIEAAARTFFDKPASELTAVEAATLAGLPQAPSAYNPRRNPDAALGRRNIVLTAMEETRVLSPQDARTARDTPLNLAPPAGVVRAPYFVEHIRRDLEERFGELLYTGGLRIQTTLDPQLQAEAEAALEEQLQQIENGTYGWYNHPTYDQFVEQLRQAGDEAVASSTPYLQATAVALDPHTGHVLALVGGRDFDHSQFNRATQALRQPGSAFKPFVYAAALENGRSPLYTLSDSPVFVTMPDSQVWVPRNYSGDYEGDLTLRDALKRSKNMVAIRLGQEIGPEAVQNVARRAGIGTPIPEYPSIYIGAAAVYPLDLIAAYSPFANGGIRVEPQFVRRIEDAEGRLIWEPTPTPTLAFPPSLAWIVTDMLREVVDGGTGYGVRNPAVGNLPYEIPAAGKTGTTNDATDVWFVGYTPDVLAGVWIGFDQPQSISGGATGGGYATPIWARVVRTFYEDREPPEPWERPADVEVRNISRWTGQAVTEDCPYGVGAVTDYFVSDAAPEPRCDPPQLRGDPQPHLPGRPLLPGQPRLPQAEDFMDRPIRQRRPR
ncbi:MAG: PBP1A family penicillin-binding protein [Gemmatimonadota bacterium]